MESFYRKNFTPFNINKLLKEKELKLQIFDYIENNVDYDEGKEFVINLFGVNEEGNSVCVVVDGFKPFFYIKSPDNKNNINDFLSRLKIFFDKGEDKGRYYMASKSLILDECKTESKKNFYGYQQKEEYFFKLVFNNSIGFHMFKKMISDLTISINNKEYILEIFEGNFDPVLRFFHMRDILPSGWIKVKEFEIEDGYSNCQINLRVFWENIDSDSQNDSVAPVIQASYDIECYSDNPDVFPIPELKNNVVTQIATAFKKYGDSDFFLKHIITLKQCAPIVANPGDPPIVVESYDTEREVLTAWSRLLVKVDPDIIYSYNGDGFDGNYLYQRSIVCGAQLKLLSFGKLKNHPGKLVSTTFSSGAYGSTDFKRLVIPGRVNFDLLIYMKREFKLSSYKLDNVAETYLSENKNPMTPRQMFEFFESGDPEKIKQVSEYCFPEGTRISLSSSSVDIKCLEKMDIDVVSWVENKGFSESKKLKFFNNGYKDCIELTLIDGTKIECTKDHKFLTKTGWIEAQNLSKEDKILQYPEPAFIDYDNECSQTFTFSDQVHLPYEKACIFARIMGYLLTDGCISDSSCYKNYSQGRTKYTYVDSMVYMGTIADAKNIQKDIFILSGYKVPIHKQKHTLRVRFPNELTKMFLSVEGVSKGKRISTDSTLPDFVKNADTPLWVVREFLKGLMGGDGGCPCLSNDTFSNVSFVQSKHIENQESLKRYMSELACLFKRFNIKTIIRKIIKNKEGLGYTCQLSIVQSSLLTFNEKIGYAYCYGKSYKLAVAASYYKLRKEVYKQLSDISDRILYLHNIDKLSRKKAIEKAHKEFIDSGEPVYNNHYSLPDDRTINWKRPERNQDKCKFRKIYFPSIEEYLKLTESYDRFVTSDNKHSYALGKDEEYTPCYYLSVLHKKEAGQKKVYDIEVENTHNFVANGSVVHNCIQDTLLPQKLIDKLNVLINQIEMSKITLVPLKFLWERGQQIKVFSQIIKRTTQKNYVIPTRTFTKSFQPDEDYDKFQGATVLEPLTGAYFDPIVTLDFQSLYPSIIRAHNFCYSTFIDPTRKLELKNVETEEIYWQEDDKEYKYLYVQDRSISVLPELLSDLFNARVNVRKKMKTEKDEFTLSVLDKKQLAIKVSMNSVYGFLASQMIKCKPIAACVTAVGRQMIMKTKNYIEKNYDASCIVYGDSVSGNTPLLLKDIDNNVCIKTIEDLFDSDNTIEYPGFKLNDETIRNEKQYSNTNYQAWTDLGWADIKKVIRHKTTKKMFRVLTHTGCVDVTEDHSLCTPDLEYVKPKDMKVGQHLLHSYPEFDKNKVIKLEDLKDTENVNKEMFIKGFFLGDGSCGVYNTKHGIKYTWGLNNSEVGLCEVLKKYCEEVYKCNFVIMDTLKSSGVYKIAKRGVQKEIVLDYRNKFYDKDKHKVIPEEILNGTFEERLSFFKGYYAADGSKCTNEIGKCIRFDIKGKSSASCLFYLCKSLGFNCSLNNTKRDIFRITCSFNTFRKNKIAIKKITEIQSSSIDGDYVYDLETEVGRFQAGVGEIITKNTDSVFVKFNLSHLPKEEQMKKAFELGKEAAGKCTDVLFKTPIKLEFEKVFNPLLLFGKKMYIGQLFSSSPDKADYIDKKGVVSKRRDNAPVVRRVYDEAVNIIMTKGLLGIDELINYIKFELNNILLDKTDIKELTISKTLKSNYKSENLPHKIVAEKMFKRDPGNAPKSNDRVEYAFIENDSKKQFEKAEDPEYILKNKLKLDSIYYIEHQLQNPLTQILNLITKEPEKIFDDITSAYKLKQKRRLLIQKQDKEGQTRITSFFKSVKQDILINDDEES